MKLRKLIQFVKILVFTFLFVILVFPVSYAEEKTIETEKSERNVPSSKGPWSFISVMRPYLTLGYHVPELIVLPNSAPRGFFEDLTQFDNWQIGIGLRINQYFGLELGYSSFYRNYVVTDTFVGDSIYKDSGTLKGPYVYLTGHMYTPAIDLKYASLEFSLHAGIAAMFGVQDNNTIIQTGTDIKNTLTITTLLPQFVCGFNVIVALPKIVAIRGFVEVITLNDQPQGVPLVLNVGVALNFYLL